MKSNLPPLVLLTSLSIILVHFPLSTSGQVAAAVDKPSVAQDILPGDAFAADIQEGQVRPKRLNNFGIKLGDKVKIKPEPEVDHDDLHKRQADEQDDQDLPEDADEILEEHDHVIQQMEQEKENQLEDEERRQRNAHVEKKMSPKLSGKLMSLGEPCDHSISQKVEKILDNSVKSSELLSLSKKGRLCDYRKFLICKSGTCQYWNPGVVRVTQSGSSSTYTIGPGFICGTYPKYYESTVRLQCVGKEGKYCSRSNPRKCVRPPNYEFDKQQPGSRPRKKSRQKIAIEMDDDTFEDSIAGETGINIDNGHKEPDKDPDKEPDKDPDKEPDKDPDKEPENATESNGSETDNGGGGGGGGSHRGTTGKPKPRPLRYGQHCTSKDECQTRRRMSCQKDHLVLRAGGEQGSRSSGRLSTDEEDVMELDYSDGLPILRHGLPENDEGIRESIYEDLEADYNAQTHEENKIPKEYYLCRCGTEFAPFLKPNGHVTCKTAVDYDCVENKDCASEQCSNGYCLMAKKFLFFIPTADHKLNLNSHPHDFETDDYDEDAADTLSAETAAAPRLQDSSKVVAISVLFIFLRIIHPFL